jgi:hypothetical protein
LQLLAAVDSKRRASIHHLLAAIFDSILQEQ